MVKLFTITYLLLTLMSCAGAELNYPKSDHFDGAKFFNPKFPKSKKSLWTVLKWKLKGGAKEWPKSVEIEQKKIKSQKVEKSLRLTFINHATTLIQMDGLNILTDPIWSERTSPVSWAGPKRVKKPGVKFDDLPNIDVVLISHNHYDHMDLPTLEKLIQRDSPYILWGLGHKRYLNSKKKKIIELDWHQNFKVKGVTFTFLPSRHWSRRTLLDTNEALWGAFDIKGTKHLYFAGDTGYSNHFKEAYEKFGTYDLSLLPIGAYEPRWFMKENHINPEEAIWAHNDLRSKVSIGIHFGTFQLTNEGIDDPPLELKKALEKYKPKRPFLLLENGESYEEDL